MSSCAACAGPSIRRAKLWFIRASEGNRINPISASQGSARARSIIAKTVRAITPVANGTGQNTSTAALDVGLHVREQLAGGRLAVVLELQIAVPVGHAVAERGHDALAGHPAVVAPDHDPQGPPAAEGHQREHGEPDRPRRDGSRERRLEDLVGRLAERRREQDRRDREQERAGDRDEERPRMHADVRLHQAHPAPEQGALGRHGALRHHRHAAYDAADDRPSTLVRVVSARRSDVARAVPRGVALLVGRVRGGTVPGPAGHRVVRQAPELRRSAPGGRALQRDARAAGRAAGRPRRAGRAELPAVRDRVLRVPAARRDRRGEQPAVHEARDGAPVARRRAEGRARRRPALRGFRRRVRRVPASTPSW